jgi:hypothetical protein
LVPIDEARSTADKIRELEQLSHEDFITDEARIAT